MSCHSSLPPGVLGSQPGSAQWILGEAPCSPSSVPALTQLHNSPRSIFIGSLLTIKESFRPDEAGITHSRTHKSSLEEAGGAPTRGHSPQEHNQAEDGQALDQGTDPGRLVLRNPEEEVEGAGKDEGDQPPADLWVLQEREAAQSPILSTVFRWESQQGW